MHKEDGTLIHMAQMRKVLRLSNILVCVCVTCDCVWTERVCDGQGAKEGMGIHRFTTADTHGGYYIIDAFSG